jgi:FtsP/CotA-like multicopper oxidase with cupredoxin domain
MTAATLLLLCATFPVTSVSGAERHFNLTVAMRMAMEYGENCDWLGQHCEPNFRAYEKGGKLLYRRGDANTGVTGPELPVPATADVLVIDGTYRPVTAVNGRVPGPTIEVYEGDTVVVHLTNRLDNEATTIHFHGMYQRGTPWMDGVSQITQCAVLPGESFTYRFIAEPAGTHFWHSHHGVQRPAGIFGALVVHPKPAVAGWQQPQTQTQTQHQHQHQHCADAAQVMLLSVWQHVDSESLYVQRDGPGWFPHGPEGGPWRWTRDVSGKLVGEIPMQSGLINGLGRTLGGCVQ